MAKFDVHIIDHPTAKEMLVEFKSQRQDNVPILEKPGHYILPDYKLTRQRKALKIRKHTYLTKKFRSYVALDSANGHTLWMRNFGSLSEAIFWLETGMKIGDTDTDARYSFKEWQEKHFEDIEKLKDQLRAKTKARQENK
ncbi:hypothetical protein AAHB41_02260 [Pediococcus pentosaceus]|jgi:glucose dehydrogenase|uniref:Uncharacterized protein n=3 Tax=Pediococcus pentosaceus TaxID=1255 RepID=A0A0R2HFI9_PEDPE|nr:MULTISPECIES: hypothetical protein [Pediococcus]ABJ67395.1 hypothetical protein PEPE_0298 [Pediococcus pentosaceus ATCC 25745]ANI98444.1 hypothetical protein AN278_008145 [Pediococcus pentosaceus]ARW20436.1 hypothetical protein S100892_01893 [Pediococcus pentosaceus]ASC09046.1 hypothetical protein S100194_01536 [Pediococcus pentosaceus]AXR42972.1 hypothetical protein CKK51_02060 [Pediococcus pentosaceus]